MDLPVSELVPGDYFQIPMVKGVEKAGMKSTVAETGPSRMKPDHTRLVLTKQKATSHIVVLPNDLVVDVIKRSIKPHETPKCHCTNHMGTRKIAFKSEQDAITALLRRHLNHGSHRIYPCPTQEGRFHITSKKEKVHEPKG